MNTDRVNAHDEKKVALAQKIEALIKRVGVGYLTESPEAYKNMNLPVDLGTLRPFLSVIPKDKDEEKKYASLRGLYYGVDKNGEAKLNFGRKMKSIYRFYTSSPNAQGIPREARKAVNKPNHLVGEIDLKASHPRLIAEIYGTELRGYFDRGEDFYQEIATELGATRDVIKTAFNSWLNGQGDEKTSDSIKRDSRTLEGNFSFRGYMASNFPQLIEKKESLGKKCRMQVKDYGWVLEPKEDDGITPKPHAMLSYILQALESAIMSKVVEIMYLDRVRGDGLFPEVILTNHDSILFLTM